MELTADKNTFSNELDITKEGDKLKLKNVQFDGQKIDVKNELELDQLRFNASQEHTKKEFEI
jgi:hypothetical protein